MRGLTEKQWEYMGCGLAVLLIAGWILYRSSGQVEAPGATVSDPVTMQAQSPGRYSPDTIKAAIDTYKEDLRLGEWEPVENGGWRAEIPGEAFVITLGPDAGGTMERIDNSEQAVPAMLRCLILGTTGLAPGSEQERKNIAATIEAATQSHEARSITMNGITFEVKPIPFGESAMLSCALR